MSNTHPNTPFGHFFQKIGIWHPNLEDGIVALYDNLHETEKEAVKYSSGIIAVINANIGAAPAFVFDLLQQKYPALSKEAITSFLNRVNAKIAGIDAELPDDYTAALMKLQDFLGKYEGNTWATITRAVVTIGTEILHTGKLSIQSIETVLEYVYQTFVKVK